MDPFEPASLWSWREEKEYKRARRAQSTDPWSWKPDPGGTHL